MTELSKLTAVLASFQAEIAARLEIIIKLSNLNNSNLLIRLDFKYNNYNQSERRQRSVFDLSHHQQMVNLDAL